MAASWTHEGPPRDQRERPSERAGRYVTLWGLGLDAEPESVQPLVEDGHLHGELDAVCPRCLRWIEERDYVRRTAYGPLQHEVCPEPFRSTG